GFARDREVPEPRILAPLPPLPGEAARGDSELHQALAVQPDYPDLHLALARARHAHGDLDQAAASCRAALGLQPGYSTAAMELARIELGRGRAEGAAELLIGLARRHPQWADAHALLGRVFRLRGDAAAAQPPLRTALSLNPGYSQAREDLAW